MVTAPRARTARPAAPPGRAPLRRSLLFAAALAALGAGVVTGARHVPSEERLVRAYGQAWERGDWARMHALLSPAARRRTSLRRFARAHASAATTATALAITVGAPESVGERVVEVRVAVRTRTFGTMAHGVRLPLSGGKEGGIAWRAHHAFPGLRPGEALTRLMRLPPRAPLLARDGTPLAEGPARASPLGAVAAEVVGRLGTAAPERAAELAERGVPPDAVVGLTGLEREFDAELAGRPGGELRAGARLLARSVPRPGRAVTTTVEPELQRAAVAALAGRLGGVAALQPDTGEVLALAGIAASAPQPPGSVFKIVTLAGALEAGVTSPGERFAVQTAATLSGVRLENANGESCGGSLRASFAHSCNSVFAPLGARLGARRLVAAAERFGFNEAPSLVGAARSTLPAPDELGDALGVGSTAIGQGKVLATPLQMASVAATIAARGRRVRPTLRKGQAPRASQAVAPATAHSVARAMRAVVTEGTGEAAALEGVRVAGKTGTAELRSTVSPDPASEPGVPAPPDDATDTDAWFAAFAPYPRARVAVAVLLVARGAGGETAAPAARLVLDAAT